MVSTGRVARSATTGTGPARRTGRGSADGWARLRRRAGVALLGLLLGSVGPTGAALADDAAASVREVALRVLVVDDGTVTVQTILRQLDVEGVPYTRLRTSTADRPAVTPSYLATGDHGSFQAVVLPSSAGGGLAPDEVAALAAYVEGFGVRQVDAYEVPGPQVGLQPYGSPGSWSGTLEGRTGTLTPAAAAGGFGYLDGTVELGVGGWGLGSTPLTADTTPAMPADAGFTPFLTTPGPGGAPTALLGVYRSGATERLVSTVALGDWQLSARLLAHGIVTWATRGVHFGYDRNYYTQHFDDAFAFDARWDVAHDCTPGEDCPAGVAATQDIRMTAADVDALVAWQARTGFRPTLAFNGYYASHDADGEPWAAPDPLTAAFTQHADELVWLNHGYEHLYQGCEQDFSVLPWVCRTTDGGPVAADGSTIRWVSQSAIEQEIAQNALVGAGLGLTFDPAEYLSGEHSGLFLVPQQPVDNPYFAAALTSQGVRAIGADASRGAAQRPVGAAVTVPRHPVALYFNVSTVAEEVDEYNWIYLSAASGGSGTCDALPSTCLSAPLDAATGFADHIVPTDVANSMQLVLRNDPRPFYAHTANLTAPDYLGLQLMSAMLDTYDGWFADNTPLVSLSLTDAADALAAQAAWAATGMVPGSSVTGVLRADGTVVIDNTTGVAAPLTVPEGTLLGGATFGDAYRGERSGWVGGDAVLTGGTRVPVFTSAPSATFPLGVAASAQVTASWATTLTVVGALPAGVVFTDRGDGTGILTGTAVGPAGQHAPTFVASSPWGVAEQAFTLTVAEPPAFTSAASTELTAGAPGTFTISAAHASSITHAGVLPAGVTFADAGDGTATLAGAPDAGASGEYPLTLLARGAGGTVEQAFTLRVVPGLAFSSAPEVVLVTGAPATVTITTTGATAITLDGVLPVGVVFRDAGDGTATLTGEPSQGSEGAYLVTLTGTDGVRTAHQDLTLTVASTPQVSSAPTARLTVGTPGAVTLTATGSPTPTLALSGALPTGVTFATAADGTATLTGVPAPTTGAVYPVVLTATNAAGSVRQVLLVEVVEAPFFTTAAVLDLAVGQVASSVVRAGGWPAPALAVSGLPGGLTFTAAADGSGVIAGSPVPGTGGVHQVRVVASGPGGEATQLLTVRVAEKPAITCPSQVTVVAGRATSVRVTATGTPPPVVSVTGQLPAGLRVTGSGAALTISGTAASGSAGTYALTVTAANDQGTVTAPLTLVVASTPVVLVPPLATARIGSQARIAIRTSGSPWPALSATGVPRGMTFTDLGDGTGALTGAPLRGTGGMYRVSVTATNVAGSTSATLLLIVWGW